MGMKKSEKWEGKGRERAGFSLLGTSPPFNTRDGSGIVR